MQMYCYRVICSIPALEEHANALLQSDWVNACIRSQTWLVLSRSLDQPFAGIEKLAALLMLFCSAISCQPATLLCLQLFVQVAAM
jgi:hypothetical protein